MKNNKLLAKLQEDARACECWPNSEEIFAFHQLSLRVRDGVLPNLQLSTSHLHDATKSWSYNEYDRAWSFELTEPISIETKAGHTRVCQVRSFFQIQATYVTADIKLAIEVAIDEVEEWRNGLREMRKLQLQRVRTTEGQEAFDAAVERGPVRRFSSRRRTITGQTATGAT